LAREWADLSLAAKLCERLFMAATVVSLAGSALFMLSMTFDGRVAGFAGCFLLTAGGIGAVLALRRGREALDRALAVTGHGSAYLREMAVLVALGDFKGAKVAGRLLHDSLEGDAGP